MSLTYFDRNRTVVSMIDPVLRCASTASHAELPANTGEYRVSTTPSDTSGHLDHDLRAYFSVHAHRYDRVVAERLI